MLVLACPKSKLMSWAQVLITVRTRQLALMYRLRLHEFPERFHGSSLKCLAQYEMHTYLSSATLSAGQAALCNVSVTLHMLAAYQRMSIGTHQEL